MEGSSGHVPASAALQEAPMHLGEATDTCQPGELTKIRCALAMQRYRARKLRRLEQCFGNASGMQRYRARNLSSPQQCFRNA